MWFILGMLAAIAVGVISLIIGMLLLSKDELDTRGVELPRFEDWLEQ